MAVPISQSHAQPGRAILLVATTPVIAFRLRAHDTVTGERP